MSAAVKIGKKAIQLANSIVNTAVLIAILLLIAFGCYAIWDSTRVFKAASAIQYEIYKPTEENGKLSFQELQKINPEVFGWLTVYGTHIDYPLTQGTDNLKYVNTNAKGNYSLSGGIFLDCNNNQDFSDFSNIIYGHHMEKQAMFGEIGLFSDKYYFDARRYGMLYHSGREYGLEFFAFAHADAYDYSVFLTKVNGRENRQAHLNMILKKAINICKDIQVTADDKIVLLTTCSELSTNGRDILIGKITNEIYSDTFKKENESAALPAIDELVRLWVKIPIWVKIIVVALLLISLVIFAQILLLS